MPKMEPTICDEKQGMSAEILMKIVSVDKKVSRIEKLSILLFK